ncbi:DUF397 domain-containing protein [Kineosporia mesophila]|uniref:DUF397 domain-containing protein n=1 Tax=Kineosporia mesophila TaxID=566012 RepID=A0ABP6Z5V7_9ACTN|nr:DUF397 domain-containing protein [Kineosporia mesophila]MCD5352689.1 DUF397 domain-containing protein [Kineosporia mesophila]
MSTDDVTWIKATKSGNNGDCVELGASEGNASVVYLRDSKNKQGAVLALAPSEIAAFIDGAKKGEFDHLAL